MYQFSLRPRVLPCLLAATASGVLPVTAVHADITGFPIPGWCVNQWDSNNASPVNPPESVTLTTGTSEQFRSMFYGDARQGVSQFQVKFTYQFTGSASNQMGAAFVLHNKPNGPKTVATGVLNHFGYRDESGIFGGPSIAVSLQANYLGAGSSSSGVYTGGDVGGGSTNTSPLSFFSGNPIDVSIGYNGFLLSMTAKDQVTGAVYNAPKVAIDIPAVVGDSLAWVGFTASTNFNAGTTQTFSNFSYSAVPSPSVGGLLALPGVVALRRRRA